MDVLILAQTSPKDSYQEANLQFFKQYAVGYNLTSDEREHFYRFVRLQDMYSFTNPVITMRRRVDLRDGEESAWQWDYFDCFKNVESAARGFVDTEYWKLENSVNSLHKQAVEQALETNALQKQLINLEHYKTFTIREKYNDMYVTELKARRLYSKAKQGAAPQETIDQIQKELREQYQDELKGLQEQIDQIHDKLGR